MHLISYRCPRCLDRWVGWADITECPTCGFNRFVIEPPELPKCLPHYSPPVEPSTLINCQRLKDEKEDRELRAEKRRGWIYDSAALRKNVRAGTYRVATHRLYHHFENWLNDASIVYIRNVETGEKVRHLAPKRGNKAYAAKYRKRMNELSAALSSCQLDEPFGATGKYRRTKALLVTFTYWDKSMDIQGAWSNVSYDLAKWKIQAKRKLGAESIATLAIKEGNEAGYPAPHMLILLDRPVIVERHVGKKNKQITWRVNSFPVLDALKDAWKRGFIDVQGICDQKVSDGSKKVSIVRYVFKYLTKAVDVEPSEEPDNSIRDKYRNIGIKTFAWQKLLMLRPLHISKSFKDFVRLDTAMHESQHGVWIFDHSDPCRLLDVGLILASSMPPDPYTYPLLSRGWLNPTVSLSQQLADMRSYIANGGILTLESEEYYLKFGKYPVNNHRATY